MTTIAATIAASRLGMGARPGELDAIARNPKAWARSQIQSTPAAPRVLTERGSAAARGEVFHDVLSRGRRRSGSAGEDNPNLTQTMGMVRDWTRMYQRDMGERTLAAVRSDTPFFERLLQFWSNHFTVSPAGKPHLGPLTLSFEQEAIRPHVLGRFEDMLLASSRHAAMLVYLDQFQSAGPNSIAGRRRERGLNENLAREILELHTLGVDGGYTQSDVLALAKILTGWTLGALLRMVPQQLRRTLPEVPVAGFVFFPLMHEPGTQTLLGRAFPDEGEAQGVAALRYLAAHPSTARFVATKLARHFVADDPPVSAVQRLESIFLQTGGDLRAVSDALIDLPELWAEPLPKLRSPNEYVIAMLRATGLEPAPDDLFRRLRELGQQPMGAPSPAGWPDVASAWLAPEALMRRVETAQLVAQEIPRDRQAMDLLRDTIGPAVNADTALWISQAESAEQGYALVLASAEFQRR